MMHSPLPLKNQNDWHCGHISKAKGTKWHEGRGHCSVQIYHQSTRKCYWRYRKDRKSHRSPSWINSSDPFHHLSHFGLAARELLWHSNHWLIKCILKHSLQKDQRKASASHLHHVVSFFVGVIKIQCYDVPILTDNKLLNGISYQNQSIKDSSKNKKYWPWDLVWKSMMDYGWQQWMIYKRGVIT